MKAKGALTAAGKEFDYHIVSQEQHAVLQKLTHMDSVPSIWVRAAMFAPLASFQQPSYQCLATSRPR